MEKKYFAAANTSGGFVNRFDDIFAPEKLERIYIIKGGSGTGKSTLMRKIAAEGVRRDFEVEYFYCSSDPDSLDGIIISSESCRGIGVLDGTAPHTRDPKLPGACEEIFNLGDFWDTERLRSRRDDIADLTAEKKRLFGEVYEYLFACGELRRLIRSDVARAVDSIKLTAAAERLLTQSMSKAHVSRRNITPRVAPRTNTASCSISSCAATPTVEPRGISAISTKGIVTFDTYRELGSYYAVTDLIDSSVFFFDALLDAARRFGLSALRAPDPLEPEYTEAVYFPILGLSIVKADGREPYETKLINMARFVDKGAFSPDDKRRHRLLGRCAKELMDGALEKLGEVHELHSRLEEIYISAMDFDRLNECQSELIKRVFSTV